MKTCPWCGQYSQHGLLCSRRCSIEFKNQDPEGYKAYNSGSGCLGTIGLVFVLGVILSIFSPNKEEKNSANTRAPTIASGQEESKLALTENHETERQAGIVSDDMPPKPTQNLEDKFLVVKDQDGYLVLKAKDGRSIRMEIVNLNTISVLLRRADGVIFDIPLKRLDANSIQQVEVSWKASHTVDTEETFYSITGIEIGDTLNVRLGAGSNYDIVARLPNGAGRIRIVGEPLMNGVTEWVQIAFGDRTGWVAKNYLKAE